MTKRRHSFHFSIFFKIFISFGTSSNKVRMEVANKFLNLSKMIIIFTPTLSFPWLKQQITSKHLIDHASKRPNIWSLIVLLSKYNLRWSILSSLYLSRKMMMFPTCISKISYFYIKRFFQLISSIEFYSSFFYYISLLKSLSGKPLNMYKGIL